MTEIIGVVSGKGGVGKTTVTANLATALHRLGRTVTVIDCNVTTPHLGFYLGAYSYVTTLNDALRRDASIRSASYFHDGIYYVPASQDLDDLTDLDVMKLKDSLAELGESDIVLLDSAPGLGREALSVLRACDKILFVTTPFLSAVNDVFRCAKIAESLGVRPIGIVLNMVSGESELKRSEIETITGLPVVTEIPFDKDMLRSLVRRMPVVKYKPNSETSFKFMQLAANLTGIPYKKKSFVSRFFSSLRKSGAEEEKIYTVKTGADNVLDVVRRKNVVSIKELAKGLGLTQEEVEFYGRMLEKRGVVEFCKPLIGEECLRMKW